MYEIIKTTYKYRTEYNDFLQQEDTYTAVDSEEVLSERISTEQKAKLYCNKMNKQESLASEICDYSDSFVRYTYRRAE